ncbi:MAG: zinc-binding dehydrogenase, partial [Acidobacteria bacterium]|nr:zinc-binding dehydrogenase [Acidobacteriota bacterium]
STELAMTAVLMQQVRIQGVLVGHRDGFEAMNRALAVAGIRPVVDRIFDLEDAPRALEHMAAGRHLGKICLRIA